MIASDTLHRLPMNRDGNPRPRPLDQQRRQCEAVHDREMRRRSERRYRHNSVRAWVVDGGTADLRSAGRGPARFIGHGLVRPPAASTAGAWTWRATGARPRIATTMLPSQRAPTTALQPRLTFSGCVASGPYWSTAFRPARCARRYLRNDTLSSSPRLALDAM